MSIRNSDGWLSGMRSLGPRTLGVLAFSAITMLGSVSAFSEPRHRGDYRQVHRGDRGPVPAPRPVGPTTVTAPAVRGTPAPPPGGFDQRNHRDDRDDRDHRDDRNRRDRRDRRDDRDHPRFAPPPPLVEHARPRRGFVWAPGYHEWRNGSYVWVGGRYEPERAGYEWVAPHWELQNGVFVMVPGSWVAINAWPEAPPPPAPPEPNVGPRPGFVWIPGYQEWRGGSYVWVAGHWEQERPRERWQNGRWERHGNRWIWHQGGWRSRGG